MLYLQDNKITEKPNSIDLLVPISGADYEWAPQNDVEEPRIVTFENPTDEQLSCAGYYKLPNQPEYDPVWQKCVWVRTEWTIIPSDAAKLRDKMWNDIRLMRDQSLIISDEIISDFITNNIDIPQEWKNYRQQMRDMPQIYMTGEINDYENIIWPERPDYLDSIGDES